MGAILTEKEAALHWCPHISREMLAPREKLITGKSAHGDPLPRCIASACMNWVDEGMSHQIEDEDLGEGEEPAEPMGRCGLSRR